MPTPPKRDEARRRRNKPAVKATRVPVDVKGDAKQSKKGDTEWHPIAKRFYASFGDSPVSFMFEPSDWAQLRYITDAMSVSLSKWDGYMSPEMVRGVITACEDLLAFEASRRSRRIEVDPGSCQAPQALKDWHPRAKDWYTAVTESGQAAFYQACDWALCIYMGECISRHASAGRNMSGLMLGIITRGCKLLLTTEGARRAARVEVAKASTKDVEKALTDLKARYAEAFK